MRKNKLYIISLIVLLCGFITIMLPSCKKSSTNNANTSADNQFQNGQRPNMSNMQDQMKKSLKELVSAGTITQKQSDKILTALTSRSKNAQGNFSKNDKKTDSSSSKSKSGEKFQPGKNGGNRNLGNGALSTLVKQKVITQKQATAVEKKIFSNFGGGQGAPGQDGNSGNTDQQS